MAATKKGGSSKVKAGKAAGGKKRELRSKLWFDNPDNPGMTALYLERYLNFGLTREELQSGKPIIGIAQTGTGKTAAFALPIIQVVGSKDAIDVNEQPWTEDGPMVNSGPFNGLSATETKKKITADLAAKGQGKLAVNFKLRDWLFSRQRYWGEPFPLDRKSVV